MKCKNCGTEFEGKFCYECGTEACPNQNETDYNPPNQQIEQKAETQQIPEQNSWNQNAAYFETNVKPKRGKKIKKPIYKRKWFVFLAIIILIIVASKINGIYKENKAWVNLDWSDIVLNDVIPEAPKGKTKISTNSEKGLYLEIKTTEKNYKSYVAACKEMGYTIDSDSGSTSYEAYNEEGYNLYVSYYKEILKIDLDEPIKVSEINWSKIKLGKMLPTPESHHGNISYEYSDSAYIYIANTTKKEFNKYIDACMEEGFDVDYSRHETYFSAENQNGWSVIVRYIGFNTMSIDIDAPDNKDNDEDETEHKESTSSVETTKNIETTKPTAENTTEKKPSGIRTEFKEAMDGYEKFMTEYVDFMNKYSESDGTNLSLLADYTKYMKDYAEMCESFDEWEDEDLSKEELSYYLDVQLRVNKKLLELSD